jgi:hypothetical protein
VIAKSTGDASLMVLVESFEAMRAPWVSGIDDVYALAREVGLRVVENFTTGDPFIGSLVAARLRHHLRALPDLTLELEGAEK